MTISTANYQRGHGKAPRGFGLWAFRIGGAVHYFSGKYSETKQIAIQTARFIGTRQIEVLA